MKTNRYIKLSIALALAGAATSCSDFLDKEPMSAITPEKYYASEAQLDAVLLDEYPNTLPGHGGWSYGIFGNDNNTDNQIGRDAPDMYTKNLWRVPATHDSHSNSSWSFYRIYYINYMISNMMTKFGTDLEGKDNTITGDLAKIQHSLGEAYFLRAYNYFSRLRRFGDFPIITEPLPDDMATLTEASKRSPRNEVARFILEDLDKAIYLMSKTTKGTSRVNRDAALLLKSRVALYEGTWEKYFADTPFVPNGTGWPGATQHAGYAFPAGSAEAEWKWFLKEAMDAAKELGDRYVDNLTPNSGYFQTSTDQAANPYYEMFCAEDMNKYPEIILWRQAGQNMVTHNVNVAAMQGNYNVGMTRQYVQNFLMADGSPVYTHGTYADGDGYYMGDKTIADVRVNRDPRLSIFLKEPGQKCILFDLDYTAAEEFWAEEPYPWILSGDGQRGYSTGYTLHKGGNLSRHHYKNNGGYTGAPIMRAAEALLNYMEASYEYSGSVDPTADLYWKALRKRAGLPEDYMTTTVNKTDMSKEAENDWGAYSAGNVLSDKILYNIRRERRCELLSEGFRADDLHRWRSYDQLINTRAHLEGFHLWGTPIEHWYDNSEKASGTDLVADGTTNSNVSSKERSEYLRPWERTSVQNCYEGATWNLAHYLDPVPVDELLITSPGGNDASASVIYQNPYWPIEPAQPATK